MATLLFVITGWVITWILWHHGPITLRRQAVLLFGITAACGLTAFINPYGAKLPKAWFAIMGSPLVSKIIVEHAPLASSPATLAAVLPAVALYLATLAGVFPKRPRVTWLLPLIWLCLAWMRVRHASLFAVTFAVVLPDMLPHVRWIKWLSNHGSEFFTLQNPSPSPYSGKFKVGPAVIPLLLIITTLGFQIAGIRLPVLGSSWAKLDPAYWPVGLIGELKSIELRVPDGTPIFNDFLYGGFIIYYAPRFRVFIDDRCELYGDSGLYRFVVAEENPCIIDAFVEEYGLQFALVMADSNFDRYLSNSKNWSMIARTDSAALYQCNSTTSKSDPR
jgi:cytochrome b subunit of formate dehydrogenase